MKPVTVSTTVARPREEVFEFLDLLASRERFMDRLLVSWSFSGPARGVGAKGRAKANAPGSQEWTEFEVVESERPARIVEEAITSGGKRHVRGTYRLEEQSGGGTEISYELDWIVVPRSERLGPPLARAFARRSYGGAMRRLAKRLKQS